MSIITDVKRAPEIILKESPNSKDSKDGDTPKEWSKETVCVASDSILNGLHEKLLLQKTIVKVRPFSGLMISDM